MRARGCRHDVAIFSVPQPCPRRLGVTEDRQPNTFPAFTDFRAKPLLKSTKNEQGIETQNTSKSHPPSLFGLLRHVARRGQLRGYYLPALRLSAGSQVAIRSSPNESNSHLLPGLRLRRNQSSSQMLGRPLSQRLPLSTMAVPDGREPGRCGCGQSFQSSWEETAFCTHKSTNGGKEELWPAPRQNAARERQKAR